MNRGPLVAIVALTLAALSGPAAPRLKDPSPPSDYFPTAVGTRWVYTTPTADLVEVITAVAEKDGVTLVTIGNEVPGGKATPIRTIEIRSDGLFLAEEAGKGYNPPVCLLKLPVQVGDSWTTATHRADLGRIQFPRQAVEMTDLQTRAGRFQAVRVQGETVFENGGQSQPSVYWYARGVGLVQLDDRVLKSFTPGKR
jgi:hypothetical protein